MVVSIGHKVASKVDNLKLKAGRERREDLNHPGMSPSWTSRKNHGGEDPPWTPQWAHRPAANGASLRPGTYRCQEYSLQNPHQILCGWYHHAPGPHRQASTVSTWAQQWAVARDPKVGVPRTSDFLNEIARYGKCTRSMLQVPRPPGGVPERTSPYWGSTSRPGLVQRLGLRHRRLSGHRVRP